MERTPEHQLPGQLIEHLLGERGWTQEVLAIVLGYTRQAVNMIVSGSRRVDAEMALKLGTVFGIDAARFLDLQQKWDLKVAKAKLAEESDPGLIRRADLFGKLPVAEMIRRGWVAAKDVRDPAIEPALARFFGVESPDEIEVLPFAAKRTDVFGDPTAAQLAWFHRVRQIAQDMVLTAPYSEAALRAALPKLKRLMPAPEDAADVAPVLLGCGVRYAIVETIGNAKIDGVAFWLRDGVAPVIAVSTRFDRIDNFWFVLRHEIEHVLRGHGKGKVMLDADMGEGELADSSVAAEEQAANEAAADFCVSQDMLQQFIAAKTPIFTERDVRGFAHMLRVHPGIVAGQVRHATGRMELFHKLLAKIRFAVTAKATVDGWGDVVPLTQH